jgi:hypothetical protein
MGGLQKLLIGLNSLSSSCSTPDEAKVLSHVIVVNSENADTLLGMSHVLGKIGLTATGQPVQRPCEVLHELERTQRAQSVLGKYVPCR